MNIKNIFNKIKSGNKDNKVLVTNFAYMSLLQVASYIFPLLTLPYLAAVIGANGFGKIAFSSAIIIWFQTVVDWGFDYTATRDLAQNRNDKKKLEQIFSDVLWTRVFLMVLSFVLLLILIFMIPKFKENQDIILVTFLLVPGKIMFPEWFFQAVEQMKYITITNLLSKLLFTLLIFLFVKEKTDFILQPLFLSLGFLLSGMISMYFIIVKWKVRIKRPNIHAIFVTIRKSSSVFINNFVPNLYNSFSIMLVGFLGGVISNGKLDAGTKFVDIAQQFMNIIGKTFFPYLSRKMDKHDLYVKMNFYISMSLSFFLFLFAPLIIKIFYTPDFYDSINILRILSITVFFMSIRNAYGTHYLILMGYEKTLRNITFWSSVIGLVLSYPFVYFFDFWGAALNIFLVKGIMAYAVVSAARKIKKNRSILTF